MNKKKIEKIDKFMQQNELIGLTTNLARLLGEKNNNGKHTLYIWKSEGLIVIVNDSEFICTAYYHNKPVISPTSDGYVVNEGHWCTIIENLQDKVKKAEEQRTRELLYVSIQ